MVGKVFDEERGGHVGGAELRVLTAMWSRIAEKGVPCEEEKWKTNLRFELGSIFRNEYSQEN